MKVDITKDGVTNALALVNFGNPGINLPLEGVMFDTVTAVISNGGKHNTRARIVAQPGKGFEGSSLITYYRPGLVEQVDLPSVAYTAAYDVDVEVLRERIGVALGLVPNNTQWLDIQQGAVGTTTACVLQAKSDSLLYQGSVTLQITWDAFDPVE